MTMPPLPSFDRPPVVETVLGVEFAPVDGWNVQHFGLLWDALRESFPRVEVHPPLSTQIETFDPSPRQLPRPSVQFLLQPDFRCWFLTESDRELLQVQNNRFIYNWRKGDTDVQYPRYEEFVRPEFVKNWNRFKDFLESEALDSPDIVQCEVTYVNHIPKGEGWNTVSEWDNVLRPLASPDTLEFLPGPEVARFNFAYTMPNRSGRLRVSGNSAIPKESSEPILHLQLSARGKPKSSTDEDILRWLDTGREWVVRGFTDLTTDQMHKFWRRTA